MTIPEDVMKAASTVACVLTHRCAGHMPGEKHSASCQHAAGHIARAILAERQRCADVAKKVAEDAYGDTSAIGAAALIRGRIIS